MRDGKSLFKRNDSFSLILELGRYKKEEIEEEKKGTGDRRVSDKVANSKALKLIYLYIYIYKYI